MITIHRATTDAERDAVYRFRYAVYVEEMGRYRAVADHAIRRLEEREDERSWNFYASDGRDIVASHRCTWGPHGFSERQIDHYRLEPFLAELPARALLVGERTMVAAAWRGTTVANDLANGAILPIGHDDATVVFGACEPHLLSFYARLGTRPYAATNINNDESGYLIPLVSFPRGFDAARDPSDAPRMPDCIQSVVNGPCAVMSPAVIGDEMYWRRVEPWIEQLRSRPQSLFDDLTDAQVRTCLARSNVISCAAGDRIVKRGGTAHNVYVLLSGGLEVRRGAQVVAALAPGDIAGETSFLLASTRTADVVVVEEGSRVLSLSERVLRTLMSEDPVTATTLLLNISRILCHRSATCC